ncbi:hypothetical protein QE152_g15882 [Popillia japonica]|uniref:Uncharacterized protein n=1 Tax=Popillia japonica TaxID=7064 RepID=A0AAW1L7U9_POPJA
MDKLLYLDLLDEVENAELEEENRENIHIDVVIRDPFTEINDRSFKIIFRMTKELCIYLINLVRLYMRPQVKTTDLDVPVKAKKICNMLRLYMRPQVKTTDLDVPVKAKKICNM